LAGAGEVVDCVCAGHLGSPDLAGGDCPSGDLECNRATGGCQALKCIIPGITQAELAVRTGKSREIISRLLGQPSNLTADTAAELLFAISGGEIEDHITYPLNRSAI
jgi:hypothetical protein